MAARLVYIRDLYDVEFKVFKLLGVSRPLFVIDMHHRDFGSRPRPQATAPGGGEGRSMVEYPPCTGEPILGRVGVGRGGDCGLCTL